MSSASRKRLTRDIAALHASPPSSYLIPPSDSLSSLTLHLLGPASTPFESGLFTLTLTLPAHTYPTDPPRANFTTKIFHPNVDPRTGDVCVSTLKRDWTPQTTLADVLVTIRCLLVYPNPTSALNEEAGRMLLEDFDGYAVRAKVMTEVHARVPEALRAQVEELRKADEAVAVVVGEASSTAGNSQPQLQHVSGKPVTTIAARKIRRPVSPFARTRRRSSSAAVSDDESGKENVVAAKQRSVSPKRAREPEEEEEERRRYDESGRKSPKLQVGDCATVRKQNKKEKAKGKVKMGLKRF